MKLNVKDTTPQSIRFPYKITRKFLVRYANCKCGQAEVFQILTETSEDISPYATFQLSEASTLAQPHHTGPANTLLHSFMYHERALQEGCSSPPPPAVLRQLQNSSPYYNIVRFRFLSNWLEKINLVRN